MEEINKGIERKRWKKEIWKKEVERKRKNKIDKYKKKERNWDYERQIKGRKQSREEYRKKGRKIENKNSRKR